MAANEALFPAKLEFLFQPKRFKVLKGGRAGAKSWGVARALLLLGRQRKLRLLCTRETQKSITESVHHLLSEQIQLLGLSDFYRVMETSIRGRNGTEFIFSGIRQQNVASLKSLEDVDICWVEEAQVVTKRSWEILIPTIRKEHSEIWITFNPELETDETYQRFVVKPPPADMCTVCTINYWDNPFLSETAKKDIAELKLRDADTYEHVYGGACLTVTEGAIYKNELIAAEKEGRISKVPYDRTKPVETFWDLGWADLTSIWFAQAIGFEFRLIDYLQGSQQALGYYLQELTRKPYVYGRHHLPHDARAKTLSSGGRSIQEQVEASGGKVKIVAQLSVADGIEAARSIFNRCWFDAEKCADGLQALRHYRFEKDEKLGTFKRDPVHDWASHGADAFRMFSVDIKEPERQMREIELPVNQYGEAGWMA